MISFRTPFVGKISYIKIQHYHYHFFYTFVEVDDDIQSENIPTPTISTLVTITHLKKAIPKR